MASLSRTLAASALLAFAACAAEQTTAPRDSPASPAAAGSNLAAASNSWSTAAPMYDAYFGSGAAVITNSLDQPVVYIMGGGLDNGISHNSQVLTYNVVRNTWAQKNLNGDEPAMLSIRGNGLARLGNVLYLTGGFNLVDGYGYDHGFSLIQGNFAYKTSTNARVPAASIPIPSADGVTAAINGKMYVLIGAAMLSRSTCPSDSCPIGAFRSLYRYDPVTHTWITRTPAPHFHRSGAGGVINGKFYVVGGFDSQGHATRNLDVYNPSTNTWTTLALLPETLTKLKAAVLQNKLFVVSPTATYAYTPGTNTWAKKATGPANSAARADGASAVTVTLDGRERMVVVGGKAINGQIPRTAVYTP